eukprot:CAMPEP_0115143734 /NCGR_PEP_ID=MMETSP0227-20121206/60966_1 /TAXON_ID=89957 /ORGANISM="Polarella glacialis, Strain CCMP 1383" /LENGTH=88 /DNA_ID=CAMNT_0002552657 /DNA_START=280 /DNA_END=543 /DNA_ORIENTATION=+
MTKVLASCGIVVRTMQKPMDIDFAGAWASMCCGAIGDQNETLVQGSSAHATSTACTAGWEWRLDETLRLEVRPLHSGDVPGWPNGSDA